MKLDDCISTVVLGYESIDDRVKDSQFNFDENDSKRNYFEGDRMNFCNHLVSHFCSPAGTTLVTCLMIPKVCNLVWHVYMFKCCLNLNYM